MARGRLNTGSMSSKADKPDRNAATRDRDARLAEALRANLHRRKQQARARADEAAPGEPESESET